MSGFDLDINNYNYEELLKLFKIQNIENIDSREYLLNKLNSKLSTIKQKYSGEIYQFFCKGKLIIVAIYDIFANKILKDQEELNAYFNKIRQIDQLDTYNEVELYDELVNSNMDINQYYDSKIVKDDNTIPDIKPQINTPYYNVGARVNPSLNNKNNTNIIYNTAVNEVSPGDLNSVKRITQLLNVNINSCFRNNYYQHNPCDFLYTLPNEITNVLSMRLVSIEIPHSWYLFSSNKKNNSFHIIIHSETSSNIEYTIVIPDGNYTADTLQHYLNTTYFYESRTDDAYLQYIKFSIDPISLKTTFEIISNEGYEETSFNSNESMSISSTSTPTILTTSTTDLVPTTSTPTPNFLFSLQFSSTMIMSQNMNTFGWALGFRLSKYTNVDKITSEGVFDNGCDRYVYVCINDFQYNNNTSNIVCFDKTVLNEDVMAKVLMVNGKLSLLINENTSNLSKIRRYNGPVNLSKLYIKILDRFGNVIDLNYMDFSMTIELEILYENFNFKNVIS